MGASENLRRSRRYAVVDAGTLQVSWINTSGQMETARTRALNVSEDGIALHLPSAAMAMLVRLRSDRFKLSVAGSVRYCRRSGSKYVVGLEFIENYHWTPPQGEVREPIPLCDPESALPPTP